MTSTGDRSKMTKNEDLKQFSEFPVPTYEEWREVTDKSLRGKSFETLMTKLMDDIVLEPMYQQKDSEGNKIDAEKPGQFPFTRGITDEKKSWHVSQELAARTPKLLNEIAKHDLGRGQTVYHIILDEEMKRGNKPLSNDNGSVGVPIYDRTDLEEVFSGLDFTSYPIHLDAGEVSLPLLAAISTLQGSENVSGVLAADPLHQLAKTGELNYSIEETYDHLAAAVKWAKDEAPLLRTVLVQTYAYHNGGASPAVELATALSTGVAYVQALIERGISVDDAGQALAFAFSVGSDYFTEVAKIRTARTLWAAIMAEFGAEEDAQKMVIHARTSSFTKTVDDTYVNMLRGTSEAFSAAAAGVNSLHVSVFDEAVQEATSFSRRIARNTSLILKEEAHIDKTVDPSGGSWYVEHLTDELAQKAWDNFQQIEREGGMLASLQHGQVQNWIDGAWAVRLREVEQRKRVIVGVNQYVNLDDKETLTQPVNQEDEIKRYYAEMKEKNQQTSTGFDKPKTIAEIAKLIEQNVPLSIIHELIGANQDEKVNVKAVPSRRLAQPFETLRNRSKEIEAQTGKRPTAYVLGIGSLADYKPRADFITGFFQSGGFGVEVGKGEQAVQDAAAHDLVVLCGQDDAYAEQAASLVKSLKEQNEKGKVFIAGQKQTELDDALNQAGNSGYIHVKTNVYESLYELQEWMRGADK